VVGATSIESFLVSTAYCCWLGRCSVSRHVTVDDGCRVAAAAVWCVCSCACFAVADSYLWLIVGRWLVTWYWQMMLACIAWRTGNAVCGPRTRTCWLQVHNYNEGRSNVKSWVTPWQNVPCYKLGWSPLVTSELNWVEVEAVQRWSAICRVWPWTFTYQKIFLCISSQGQDRYSDQQLNMYIYWFSSESGYRRRQRRTSQYNH